MYTCLPGRKRPDYTDSFVRDVDPKERWSSEALARAGLEGLPVALRWFVGIGWRLVLLLRLGPRRSTDHIAGWAIAVRTEERTVLRAASPLLDAELVFQVRPGRIAWSTVVIYRRRLASLIWPPVSILHRRIVPYALRRASGRMR